LRPSVNPTYARKTENQIAVGVLDRGAQAAARLRRTYRGKGMQPAWDQM
jgi:hypothetical protein